ncbi:hypothetical protein [Desulfolutivibrio sp.]
MAEKHGRKMNVLTAVSVEEIAKLNPELSLADILGILQWVGPSTRVH